MPLLGMILPKGKGRSTRIAPAHTPTGRSQRPTLPTLFGAAAAVMLALCACNLMGNGAVAVLVTPSPLPTETHPPTLTLTPSQTPTASRTPTATLTATITLTPSPSATPTATLTPSATFTPSLTPTVTNTPFPTVAPQATVGLAIDQFARVTIDPAVVNGIGQLWLAFANTSPKEGTLQPGTPVAGSNVTTVNIASPDGGQIYTVTELPATTSGRIFWSPDGAYIAYFLEETGRSGLYALDIRNGISIRLFALETLNPRSILDEPSWSPDGRQIALVLPTAYDVDIFAVGPDGTNFRNLTQHGAYDFWGRFSPDGRYLAFVSDRAFCPTWTPNAPGSCYTPDAFAPDGGNPYLLDLASGLIIKLADVWVRQPPTWINSAMLSLVGGDRSTPSSGSTLYIADVQRGVTRPITSTAPNGIQIARETWTADGSYVVYQELGADSALVVRDANGTEIARTTAFAFPRFAFAAAWSPDGSRLALAGRNSACPFGLISLERSLQGVTRPPAANPGACSPFISPDGSIIAFTGVSGGTGNTDGRFDVYLANSRGAAIRNLTGRLGGQVVLLGWINAVPSLVGLQPAFLLEGRASSVFP
ncbi:MAG TPA: hypothetical protein PLD47_16030 [Aggregatilineales bacterium]|nr:PD40 domain-containing protein [Anaerolineales bacterium]HRE49237.1 hypothetical protein [Aggregatilineales bacterium]